MKFGGQSLLFLNCLPGLFSIKNLVVFEKQNPESTQTIPKATSIEAALELKLIKFKTTSLQSYRLQFNGAGLFTPLKAKPNSQDLALSKKARGMAAVLVCLNLGQLPLQ